jgi:hypothetical protein
LTSFVIFALGTTVSSSLYGEIDFTASPMPRRKAHGLTLLVHQHLNSEISYSVFLAAFGKPINSIAEGVMPVKILPASVASSRRRMLPNNFLILAKYQAKNNLCNHRECLRSQ